MFTALSRCLLLLLAATSLSYAAEPTPAPILRIDAGIHMALIGRIAVDAAGRYLVTASDDKTAKVWELSSGRLLTTLRPPQDSGDEGKLYAVAMSPDGATVAVGGWTQAGETGVSIYLLDRASGRLLQRLSGLPEVILDLAWSADGRWLAAGLGSKNGIHVYRTDSWQQVGSDADIGDSVYGLDFSRDGKLVASSDDGYLRLYSVGVTALRLLAKHRAPGGKHPYAVRFSPDASKIAVGFADSTLVNVLDSATLSFLYAPDTAGVNGRNLGRVAWSADGQSLWAGGKYTNSDSNQLIRRWANAGRGAAQDSVAAAGTIMDIRHLPQGEMVFGAGGPAWGVLAASGARSRFVAGPIADFRDNHQGFRLSRDGMTVGFGYKQWGKSPARFDFTEGLSLGESAAIPLAAPLLAAAGLSITDWKNTTAPKLNGTALPLRQHERSRSLAIAADGSHFVLGTEWRVRLFERNGTQRWEVPTPGAAWAVNLSGDGRTVVAAFGDGTIRWYGISDGKEKLALFPHADQKRWVMWTPSGYYTASPGGEELIGWHLNQGKDAAADFFPASRFRAQFYRPDVIALALQAGSEAEALRLANEQSGRKNTAPVQVQNVLPPVVSIVSPTDSARVSNNAITLRYTVRSADDAPVTAIRVRVNGQAVSDTRALKRVLSGDTQEITVTIPAADSEIQLFAENKNGVSTPATLRLTWAGKQPAAEVALFKPKLYVLAVGVSKYKNPDYNLGLAAKDAKDFAAVLQKQKGKLYSDVIVKLLTDENASKDEVLEGLEWLKAQVTSRDVGMMFLAGHGVIDNTGKYYFLPHNADADKLRVTGVAQNDIKETLNSLAGKVLFFVDSCHSGNALGTAKTRNIGSITDAFVNELASAENGVIVFASSTGKQLSQEKAEWGNGAFTKALVEGLSGRADFAKNGKITHKGLDYYVTERVKELTKGQQSPVSISPNGVTDFPVALVR